MFKHGSIYLLAKLVPAIASFFVLAIFTRYMTPEQFGIYSTLLVLASSSNNFTFGWLYVGIMRFWDQKDIDPLQVQRLIVWVVGLIALVMLVLLAPISWLTGSVVMPASFMALFLAISLFNAMQRIYSMNLQVLRFAWIELARTVTGSVIGITLVMLGWHWYGAIVGLALGVLLSLILAGALPYLWVNPFPVQSDVLKRLWQYGLPLSLSLALLEVIHVSDRLLLSALDSYDAAGQYSVAFNVPHQIIMMLMASLNLAAYPPIIKALEQQGEQVARDKLHQYALVLMGVAIPAVFGLISISPDFIPALIGAEFVDSALLLMPWVSLVVFLNCSYLFYVSLAFQLANHTSASLSVVAWAAAANLLLNISLIPAFGVLGALVASAFAYAICFFYGLYRSRDYFHLPLPWKQWGLILLAAMTMYVAMEIMVGEANPVTGSLKIILGISVYGVMVYLLNIGQVRQIIQPLILRYTRCES